MRAYGTVAARTWVKARLPIAAVWVRSFHGWVARRRARRRYLAAHLPCLADLGFDAVYLNNAGNHPSAHLRRTTRYVNVHGASVLCLGCRDGLETTRWLARGARRVVGLDFFQQPQWRRLQQGDAVRRPSFIAGDARRIPFADGTFDLVSSESLLEHVSSPQDSIEEMFRVTKPGGVVFAIFGPLFYTSGGAHFEGTYEHLLQEREEFIAYINRRGRPIEHSECLFYFKNDMFSYWAMDRYLQAFSIFERLYSALFVSAEALTVRRTDPDVWQRLRDRYEEKDLLVSGLGLWLRRPA